MDIVFIEKLRIDTIIGIYDCERQTCQTVSLDLKMAYDNRAAGASDAIADALDYEAVSHRLKACVEGSRFGLIEALAEHCAKIVIEEFGVTWLRLTLRKPDAVRGAEAVGVIIERGHRPDIA